MATTAAGFPLLKLVFDADGGPFFLSEGEFQLNEERYPTRNLNEKLGTSSSIRAICILLLLAKFRGRYLSDKEGIIQFKVAGDEGHTWIHTAAVYLQGAGQGNFAATLEEFCVPFVSGSRGNFHKPGRKNRPDVVRYHFQSLPFENLTLCKRFKDAKGRTKTKELKGEALRKFAETLEKFEIDKTTWTETVPIVVRQIRIERAEQPRGDKRKVSAIAPEHVHLTARWETFFLERKGLEGMIDQRFAKPQPNEYWYVLCISPTKLIPWKHYFQNAVTKYNVNVRWIMNSPALAKSSAVAKAQWEMLYAYLYGTDNPKFVEKVTKEMEKDRREVASWVAETQTLVKGGNECGSYEFFKSEMVHPFMGILATPFDLETFDPDAKPPMNTVALLQLYPMFPNNAQERCGLYLDGPSEVLEIYFRSFLRFFSRLRKHKTSGQRGLRYLKKFDIIQGK